MRAVASLFLVLAACGLQSGGLPGSGGGSGGNGGGTAGGSGTGGGLAAGGGSTAGGAGGGTGTGGGAGGGTSGGLYEYAALNIANGGGGNSGPITSISGRTGEIYAAADYGYVYRSTDGINFTRLPPLGNASISMEAVYVAPDGSVFLSSGSELGVCRSGCTTAAGYTWRSFLSARYTALCGDSASNVFAVGAVGGATPRGKYMRYDGNAWSAEITLPVAETMSCWLESSRVLWIGGVEKLARWEDGAITTHGADLSALGSERDYQSWRAVFGIGGYVHAVGHRRRAMTRTPAGVWSLSYDRDDTAWLSAVAALRTDEVFAGGSFGPEKTVLLQFDGTQWAAAPDLTVLSDVRAAWVAGTDTLYFGGEASSGVPGIERAKRR